MMLRHTLLLLGFIAPIALTGTVRTTGDSRIIGGTVASTGEYPSQLSLQLNGVHRCGASVINGYWALTTAYCVDVLGTTTANFTVLSGTNSLTSGGTRHTVTNIKINELYDPDNSWLGDIALLKVPSDEPFEGNVVQAIAIPDQNFVVIEMTPVTVVGWGSQEEGGPIVNNLYEAELEIANFATCQTRYAEMEETVTTTQICAASTVAKRGSCSGDTGGPLLWIREDDPTPEPNLLVGLVSWGLGCARPGYPTVYTRVASYCAWIKTKTNDNKLCNL